MSAFILTLNLNQIGCLTFVRSYIDIRLVLLQIWRGRQIDPTEKKLPSKSPALLELNLCFILKKLVLLDENPKNT